LPFLKTQVLPNWLHNFYSLSLQSSKHPFFFFTSFAFILPRVSTLHLLCSRVSPLYILDSWRLVSGDGFGVNYCHCSSCHYFSWIYKGLFGIVVAVAVQSVFRLEFIKMMFFYFLKKLFLISAH
jgi:hypothetical protein